MVIFLITLPRPWVVERDITANAVPQDPVVIGVDMSLIN